MSAIAEVLVAMGHDVSGSDAADSAVLRRLADRGVVVHAGHRPDLIAGVDAVVVSTAIPAGDPEVAAARSAGIPVLRRAEALASICATRRTIAVAGTHGKTTTTAMLGVLLRDAGRHPSFIVGGEVAGLGSGAAWDDGDLFVVEADESDGTFLDLGAWAAVVTNVEPDHLDFWGDVGALHDAFRRFMAEAPGPKVVCADDPTAAALAAGVDGAVTYGTAEGATYRVSDVETDRGAVRFRLAWASGRIAVRVAAPGLHNARNAAAAAAVALELGVEPDAVVAGLAAFEGVRRRFELRGEAGGVTFVDSYDHLPAEVAAALTAARAGGWRRIVCAFQPHRYTRTAALWRDFADAFVDADLLAVTDVYSAGQAPIPGVTGKLIVDAVLDEHPFAEVAWLPGRDSLRSWLLARLRPGDLCLTLGAGDLTTLPDELLDARRG